MELSTIVTIASPLVTFIGLIFVMRYMIGELKGNQGMIFKRLDKHGDDIVALNTRSELAVTAKDVDEKYVSKELFYLSERCLAKRLDIHFTGDSK